MSKILVCGGTGFVGAAIVRELVENNHQVRVLTRGKKKPLFDSKVEMIQGNLSDPLSLENAMKNCDVVINAAQFDNAPFENPSKGLTYEKVDAQGTEAIVAAAKKSDVRRILYISGAGTSDQKTEPWFKAKARAEKSIRNSGMTWTIFRPSWIYGPGDRSLNRMIPMIRYSPFVFILGKGYRIQPIYISDVAHVVCKAVNTPQSYDQIYELGGPQKLTMKEILHTAAMVLKKSRLYVSIPKSWAVIPFSLVFTRAALDFITMDVTISDDELKKVQNDFHTHFLPLHEGLKTYLS